MQFEIEDLGAVRKRVQFEIPARNVDSTYAVVYNQIAQKASLPGFRKGKVPVSHIRKLYADQAQFDVTQRLIESGWKHLLDENEEVVPLSEPELDADAVVAGQAFKFTMTFDVAPTFELSPVDGLSLEKEAWVASEAVVDKELEHLAGQFPTFSDVEGRDEAQLGDKVILDYAGSIEGEAFQGGTADDAELELGSGRFIPGFEEKLVGCKVGASLEVEVPFPEDYPAEHLAGKPAVFACTIKSIQEKKIPSVGPELAEAVGEENLDSLKAKMKEEIEGRFNRRAEGEARESLRKLVGDQYDFEVPASLLTASMDDRRNQLRADAIQSGKEEAEADAEAGEKIEEERENVTRDIRAHLVLDSFSTQEKVEVSDQDVFAEIQDIARTTGPYGMQIMQMYQDPNRRAALARRMRHDKVLDFLLTQANVTTVDRDVPANDAEHDEHAHSDDE